MIIFSDFDGTINVPDSTQTARNLRAIQLWRAAGQKFALATGRGEFDLSRTLPDFADYFDYLALDSGAILVDHHRNLLYEKFFAPNELDEIEKMVKRVDSWPRTTYYNFAEHGFRQFERLERTTKMAYWFNDDALAGEFHAKIKSLGIISELHPIKDQSWLEDELKGTKTYVEINPSGSGKNVAIEEFMQDFLVPKTEIVTVGDGENDQKMVEEFAGFAIAGSKLEKMLPNAKTIDSVEKLIHKLT